MPTTLSQQDILTLAKEQPDKGYAPNQVIGLAKTNEIDAVNVNPSYGLMASSTGATANFSKNSTKLDGKITQTTGVTDVKLPDARDTGTGGGASYGWKKVLDPKTGMMKEIPSSADAAAYGYTEVTGGETKPPTEKTGDTTKETIDPFTKQMNDQTTRLDSDLATSQSFYEDFKTRQDATLVTLIDSIQKKYEARRAKMQDINTRMLEGKRIAGIQSGRQRYAPGMEEGLLSTEEMDGQARLSALDAEEMSLIAKAKQARDEESYTAFTQHMDRIDKLNKEKIDVITKLHQASIDQDKAIEEKRRNAITEEQSLLNLEQDKASSYAKGAYEMLQTFKTEEEKNKYIEELATAQKIDPEILRGAIDEYGGKQENIQSQIAARESAANAREQSLSIQEQRLALAAEKADKGTKAEQKANAFSSINYLLDPTNQEAAKKTFGAEFVDVNGYITPQGFKILAKNASEEGISRKELLAEYGSMLYIAEGKGKEYGLTAAEEKILATKSEATSIIDKEFIKQTFPNLDEDAMMTKVEGYRKAGFTDKEIITKLEEQ